MNTTYKPSAPPESASWLSISYGVVSVKLVLGCFFPRCHSLNPKKKTDGDMIDRASSREPEKESERDLEGSEKVHKKAKKGF